MEWPFVRRFKLDAVLTVNQVYLDEINRLNQELASELNSHREINEQLDFERDYTKKVEKELQETKDALKIAQENLKEITYKKVLVKQEILKVRGYLKTIAKKL